MRSQRSSLGASTPKTAQHIFLELKYKLKVADLPPASAAARPSSVFRDAVDGLLNLGYPEEECAPLVRELLERSFARMDEALVMKSSLISPAGKRLFARVRGIKAPRTGGAGYYVRLGREALYRVRANGLGFAVDVLRRRLRGGRV